MMLEVVMWNCPEKLFLRYVIRKKVPFIVKTSIAGVQVLGTCFQVRADLDTTSIFVDSGNLRFYRTKVSEMLYWRLEKVHML